MKSSNDFLSIVSPVYKADSILPELIRRIDSAMQELRVEYELILVEDSSPDNSWGVIEKLSQTYSSIVGLKLSRNFGQHHAITAGLDIAKGVWVVVMDCDLQDQPEEIGRLFEKAKEGYKIVQAKRVNRKDSFIKRITSVMFYKVFNWLSGMKLDGTIANFGIYHKDVILTINSMREPTRGFPSLISWVGYSKSTIDVNHSERYSGETSYTWNKLINLAIDLSVAHSDKPLKMMVKTGGVISIGAFLCAILYFMLYIFGVTKASGFTTLIVSIWLLSGLIILFLGIIGMYLGKVYAGIKDRPLYIIEKTINGTSKQ